MNEKERFQQIKSLVLEFEEGKFSPQEAISRINDIAIRPIEIYDLLNYWCAEDLDDFVSKISVDAIADWVDITESRALELINEVLLNPYKEAILTRNIEALEKRYRKTNGIVMDLIFNKNLSTPEEILKALKRDTVIRL